MRSERTYTEVKPHAARTGVRQSRKRECGKHYRKPISVITTWHDFGEYIRDKNYYDNGSRILMNVYIARDVCRDMQKVVVSKGPLQISASTRT